MSAAEAEYRQRRWYEPAWYWRATILVCFTVCAFLFKPVFFLLLHAPEIPLALLFWTVAGARTFSWDARNRKRFAAAAATPALSPDEFRVLSVSAPGMAMTAKPLSIPPAICQVCGETIRGKHVVCGACQTPHHEDCWHYMKKCSTFACDCPIAMSAITGQQSVPARRPRERRRAVGVG